MAKIYETKEDITREVLATDAAKARSNASEEKLTASLTAPLAIAMGSIGLSNQLEQQAAKQSNIKIGIGSKFGKWAAYTAAGVGAILSAANVVFHFSDKHKAEKAQAALDKLGPQQIIVPDHTTELPVPPAGKADFIEAGHAKRLEANRQAAQANSPVKS